MSERTAAGTATEAWVVAKAKPKRKHREAPVRSAYLIGLLFGLLGCTDVVTSENAVSIPAQASPVASMETLPPLTRARTDLRREVRCIAFDWTRVCVGDTEHPDRFFGSPDATYPGTDGLTFQAFDVIHRGRVGCWIASREPYRIERILCDGPRTWFEP